MKSRNKVELVGFLGQDPETRYMTNGAAVTTISVATTEKWKDKNTGQQMEATEWHRVVFFRRLAEIAGEYLRKGSAVLIDGRLKTRRWQDSNGADRWTTEIIAEDLNILPDGKTREAAPQGNGYAQDSTPAASSRPAPRPPAGADFEDDIPF